MDDADESMLMPFENVDTGHFTYFLPVVEKDVNGVAIVDVFEGNDVVAKLCTKIMGVHAATDNIFSRMKSGQNTGTLLYFTLTLWRRITQTGSDDAESPIHSSWRKDFPTDFCCTGKLLVGDVSIENMALTALLL